MARRWVILVPLGLMALASGFYAWLLQRGADEPHADLVLDSPAGPAAGAAADAATDAATDAPIAPDATWAGHPGLGMRLVRGRAEVRRGALGWVPLGSGEVLRPREQVRTGGRGVATVQAGDLVQYRLGRDSTLTVGPRPLEVLVQHGSIEAELLRPLPAALAGGARVTSSDGAGLAITQPGSARLTTDGRGATTAVVLQGQARFFAAGKAVDLESGASSTAGPQGPSAPEPISSELLYSITWPPSSAVNTTSVEVTGQAPPGTRFFLKNAVVVVGADRSFTAQVPLREGPNTIQIEIEDPLGRTTKARSPRLTRDTRRPGHKVETSPGMWGGDP